MSYLVNYLKGTSAVYVYRLAHYIISILLDIMDYQLSLIPAAGTDVLTHVAVILTCCNPNAILYNEHNLIVLICSNLQFNDVYLRYTNSPSSAGKLLSLFPDKSRYCKLTSIDISGGNRVN